nr:MAG TPA: hypothetical protein [Caudoviricetes sp.]
MFVCLMVLSFHAHLPLTSPSHLSIIGNKKAPTLLKVNALS